MILKMLVVYSPRLWMGAKKICLGIDPSVNIWLHLKDLLDLSFEKG